MSQVSAVSPSLRVSCVSAHIWEWKDDVNDHALIASPVSSSSSPRSSLSFALDQFNLASSSSSTAPTSPSIGRHNGSMYGGMPKASSAQALLRSDTVQSFPKHSRFYFEDGTISFLVENILYRVHRYFFCQHSDYFADRLTPLPNGVFTSSTIISLLTVKSVDFDAFLSFLYPSDYDDDSADVFTIEGWTSVLLLATKWGFASIRARAIRRLDALTNPFDRLVLGRAHGVDKWIVPALTALCERHESVALAEARLMKLEDHVLIGTIRDFIHTSQVPVSSAEVQRHVREWLDFYNVGVPYDGVDEKPVAAEVTVEESGSPAKGDKAAKAHLSLSMPGESPPVASVEGGLQSPVTATPSGHQGLATPDSAVDEQLPDSGEDVKEENGGKDTADGKEGKRDSKPRGGRSGRGRR